VFFVVEIFNLGIPGNLAHFRHLNFLWFGFDRQVPSKARCAGGDESVQLKDNKI
jgi:hypothetical protein